MPCNAIDIFHIQSMGTLDGPGVRTVIFLKGCPLKCAYCHNPESWQSSSCEQLSEEALLQMIGRLRDYYGKEGGVTFSGGEPLLQADRLIPIVKKLKQLQIHVAIDTSGDILTPNAKAVLELVDLVILDVKHTDSQAYEGLTGGKLSRPFETLDYLKDKKIPYWIRQVVVPEFNDSHEQLEKLELHTRSALRERIELLGFHKGGMHKWNVKSPFEKVEEMPMDKLVKLQSYVNLLFKTD